MAQLIDIHAPRYRQAAAQILLRHDNFQPEANINSAVRDFLILTGLAQSEEIVEENPPSDASRRGRLSPLGRPSHWPGRMKHWPGCWARGCTAMWSLPVQISTVPCRWPTCTVLPAHFQWTL